MNIALEVTVKAEVPKDDGQTQEIETVITLNWDHVTSVAPRLNGGSIITLANGRSMICRESRAEINAQLRGDQKPIPAPPAPKGKAKGRAKK